MSERPVDHEEQPMYQGWTILPCPVPLPAWPLQRYFLSGRPGVQNEFERTMYEDFVDAFCADHAIARAESLYGRSWGSLSRIEWISPKGEHQISEFPTYYKTSPDGTREPTRMPQMEAKPEWREAVQNNDEDAILRLMKRELAEAAEWVNPSVESLEELSELARKQKIRLAERNKELKERAKAEQDRAGGAA